MKQFNLKTFNKLLSEVLNFAPADQFHGINNPTLFVAGSNEQPINIESVSLMANAMNNAVGTIAPDVNHGWSGENPYLFADMIEQWVSKGAVATGLELVVDKRQQVMLT